MLAAAIAVSALSAALWATCIADMASRFLLAIVLAAAVASTVTAAVLWCTRAMLRHLEANVILARAVGDLIPSRPASSRQG